ncbi:hypothetical protein CROQUDRAFT_98609 [Cronartium quercuum f. sp. fusiforme G11]|uniref:Uncharacterized protein n=1 Tax=Cronartium quercuum f. sp. fusiforme G11 TaxID=708437 RepID=A0A9P6T723_9BASI|nr:hypothetical protein CROQUDRAFT_98609 [Cronartium quercuum f. sp. fusiforme G11]
MFLEDASQSLLGKSHPDEKLSDKNFNEKYWAKSTREYIMEHMVEEEEDEDNLDANDKGESIDLKETDEEEDGEDEEYEEEEEEEEEKEQYEEEEEDENDDENWNQGVDEEVGFEGQSSGKGFFYVADEQMIDEDDDAHALRYDAWHDVSPEDCMTVP